METVQNEGGREVKRNLDAIIAVGQSEFRKAANF